MAILSTNTRTVQQLLDGGIIEPLVGHDAEELQIQFSLNGTSGWSNTPNQYIRISTNGGKTWTDPYKIKGDPGRDGRNAIDGRDAPNVQIQYSPNGTTNWSGVVDDYIRFSSDDGVTWTEPKRYVGRDGVGQNEIVDMHDGLRDATIDDYGKIGLGPDGRLYRVKRKTNPGHDAAGTFNVYTHAQFRGVEHNRPSNPQVGETYYNIRIHQWYLFFENRVVVQIDAQPITAVQALGANTVWLGEVDDNYQAIHAIENFDNTKAYYAIYNETLYVLDNSTYSAPTTQSYSYEWVEDFSDGVVSKADLNPIARISKNFVRRSELQDTFHLDVFNIPAVFPDVDQVIITFAGISVINKNIDSTWKGESLVIVPAIEQQVLDGTVHGQEKLDS